MPLPPVSYPTTRTRRMRTDDWSRRLVREVTWSVNDLVWPLFIIEGIGQTELVDSLPGVSRYSINLAVEQAKHAESVGIPAVAIFPCIDPNLKTDDAREATNPNGLATRAIEAIKRACPNLGVMCDVALDLYTTHGHDGLVDNDVVVNDATVDVLVKQALCYANAGVDMVGPSDMMDGRVGAIRQALETQGHHHTKIVAYSAKYDSGLYGPYRDAVGSKGNLGKSPKSTYQQDPTNRSEALLEASLDVSEGADVLMVKPGLYYLDVIQNIKEQLGMPTWAYMVSGEYAMIKAAEQNGWMDGKRVMHEAITCLKRAGTDAIVTYAALELAEDLAN